MQVAAAAGRIGGSEVGAQHVSDRHAHLATGASIANHRSYDVGPARQCVNRADRGRFFTGAEPRLGDHTRAHPAFELDVVEPRAQQTAIQLQLGVVRECLDDGGALVVGFDRLAKSPHERGVGLPADVFGWIESGEPLHITKIFP